MTASLRVGMFTELYVPHVGGQEQRFAELAEALVARGHDVDVFCVGHARDLPAHESINGVRVHRAPIVDDYRRSRVPGMPRGAVSILRYAWACRRAALRHDFDLHLYNQWPFGHVLLAPAKARRRGVLDWCEVRGGPVYGRFERLLPRLTSTNVAVSTAVAAGIGAASHRPVIPLPSGVTLERYRSDPFASRSGLLSIGRLFPHKRVDLVVRAFGELRARGFAEGLTIAGTGPAAPDVEAAIAALPEADRAAVRTTGHVDEAEKIELLARAKVLLVTSEREGFPRVVAEAMASGTPVVTTDDEGNGTKDVVTEHALGVVTAATPAAVATGVSTVLERWDTYARSGREASRTLDWGVLVPILEGLVPTAELVAR